MHLDHPKSSRAPAAFTLAILLLAVAAIPTEAQTYSDLHDFNASAGDPSTLYNDGVIPQGRDGDLYGTSEYGGTSNAGTVFKITTAGTPTVIASLDSTTGDHPLCGLTFGTDSNFYGVTDQGGTSGAGTVYKVTPTGTLTVLHNFTNGADSGGPTCPPVQASNGNFYGVTTGLVSGVQGASTFYEVTSTGSFTTLHTFANSEGQHCSGITLGTDGTFYGACQLEGANGDGTLYKVSTAGKVTVLHSLNGTEGLNEQGGFFVQANDGNFYGIGYNGGPSNYGVIFQLKPTGAYKVIHNFTGGADGGNPNADLALGADGNLYATASVGGSSKDGVIFKITTAGVFSVLYNFDGTHGSNPQSNLTLHTDGLFYGETQSGGAHGDGVFFSFNLGFKPFVTLYPTSGKVGTKVGIMGQGFDSTSVVKFGGVKATSVTLAGTTYITATVPAGAIDGYVTVTTGSTTLTSTQTFIVHNSWSSGKAIPVAVAGAATGLISGKIYVVGGFATYGGEPVNNNQIYNPSTNMWTTGAAIPTPVWAAASAVVSGILYVIGGYEGPEGASQNPSNLVQAYNPKTNTWSTKSAMPTARGSTAAAVDSNAIYVIGGNGSSLRLNTVEKFVPSTDTWTEEAPLLVGKSEASAGLVGSTIVAADGYNTSGETGDNEGYTVSTNTWSSLTADPTPRNASCYGVLSSQLYVAGGLNSGGASTTTNESYSVSSKKWTTQAAMPTAALWQGSAVDNGLLYCVGGQASFTGAVISNVQIYQP
jgi:uncharacterized repeat protein (TIGR03803 family)